MKIAPRDGTVVLLLTRYGVVSGWYAPPENNEHYFTPPGEGWTEPTWVCYDDQIQIEVEEQFHELYDDKVLYIDYGCYGWLPLPEGTEGIWNSHGISHSS